MKILLIGNGGREHAIAWKLAQSPQIETIFIATGNAGTAQEKKLCNIPLKNHEDLIHFCQQHDIAFTIVGPEAPLAAGIVDDFHAAGLKIFGPTRAAAQLESSKDFAKNFMYRHQIPTAKYQTFHDAREAHLYVEQQGAPIVIKADGLAAGKGVIVAMTLKEAHAAIDNMLSNNIHNNTRIVIEEFLQGEEASFIVISDGEHILTMASSQDHKRLLNQDLGPNTGGMGAYSPAPIVTPEVEEKVIKEIIIPTIQGMKKDGHEFTGFLYAGLMIDQHGNPKTIEFNCRLGDPETQVIIMRLKSHLHELIIAALDKKLNTIHAKWNTQSAVGVVLAAENYPNTPRQGDTIYGLNTNINAKIFHAGTTQNANGDIITCGGRVLCITALGNDIATAQKNVYRAIEHIHFDGMQYRNDIAAKALKS